MKKHTKFIRTLMSVHSSVYMVTNVRSYILLYLHIMLIKKRYLFIRFTRILKIEA